MKKFDIKKIGIILAIVLVVVLGIFLIGKAIKSNSVDKESLTKYENYTINYFLNLTSGLNTPYGGDEALYASDETKIENITNRQLIKTAISYLSLEGKLSSVDNATLEMLYSDDYPEITKSAIYKANDIRESIKVLFGIDTFLNPTIKADATYLTNYVYLSEEDLYLVYSDETTSARIENQVLDYSVIGTEAKKDKIVTTVAIAYCYKDGETKTYATDRFGENVIAKDAKEFPKDKIDEFDKYEFTLTKSKDGKTYVFESVKKVK